MSDAENTPPTPKTAAIPPPGAPKTSAVPLKKETVRITLRARPGAGAVQPREATAPVPMPSTSGGLPPPTESKRATAPIQLPSAPLPPPSPKASTNPVSLPPAPIPPPGRKTMQVPAAPAPSVGAVPAPGAPPRPAAPAAPSAPRPMAPSAPGAPRPPAPGAPRVEAGAVTQPLSAAPRPPVAAPRPPTGTGTAPLGGSPTAALPKATQKLQATQPLNRPAAMPAPPSAPVKRTMADAEQFYEEKDPDAGLAPISAFCLVIAVVLMGIQVLATDRVFSAPASEESGLMVPAYQSVPWEMRNDETHEVTSKFKELIHGSDYELPQ